MVRGVAALTLMVVVGATAACGSDTVRLAFAPPVGASVGYTVTTQVHTLTNVPGTAPDIEQSSILNIEQHVVARERDDTVVAIVAEFLTVTQSGLSIPPPNPVTARFSVAPTGHAIPLTTGTAVSADTARQGLPEITASFPNERVRPGQEWSFPPPVGRGGFGGRAKLVRLGRRDGVAVAEIEAVLGTTVEETEIRGRDGPVTIGGPLELRVHGFYEVATGLMVESSQELRGDFRLRFSLNDSASTPVVGSQQLTVLTTARRV